MSRVTHHWAAAALAPLTLERATELAALDAPDRLNRLIEFVAGALELRGPVCRDCRVHWRDAERFKCPGKRPEPLGGPLDKPERVLSRQERRLLARKGVEVLDRAEPMYAAGEGVTRYALPNRSRGL